MIQLLPPIILACALAAKGPVVQDEAYHGFADARSGAHGVVPNFCDVVSNVAFAFVSLVLMAFSPSASEAYAVFLRALLLVAPSSAYYHWRPTSRRLVVDRAAMSAAFGALIVHGLRLPSWTLWPCVASSMGTVAFWARSGDLRPYIVLQYGGAASLLLFSDCSPCIVVYAVAKACERLDRQIFDWGGGRISGHTLKHIFAAMAALGVPMR